MPENNLYYIYIDSKIEGTIDQLLSYFQANVFHSDDCICIYFKFYKEIEKYIIKKLNHTSIRYQFIRKNSDFKFQKNKVVFYLFNAQSNCRVVAHRELTHIFVTHGESHKLASIKPIIRIYDFVITSGRVGIERFLKAGVFNRCNIDEEKRVIAMGNTFIGQHQYEFNDQARSLLYAPTWEGGVPAENYSSIGQRAQLILSDLIKKHQITTLYIQLHPNLGHRDQRYLKHLKALLRKIKALKIQIVILKSNLRFKDRWTFSGYPLLDVSAPKKKAIAGAVVDISAMEMQLLSEKIPTLVLYRAAQLEDLVIPERVKYLYSKEQALDHDGAVLDLNIRATQIAQHQDYLIGYHEPNLEQMSFQARIQWLCQYAMQQNKQLQQKYLDAF